MSQAVLRPENWLSGSQVVSPRPNRFVPVQMPAGALSQRRQEGCGPRSLSSARTRSTAGALTALHTTPFSLLGTNRPILITHTAARRSPLPARRQPKMRAQQAGRAVAVWPRRRHFSASRPQSPDETHSLHVPAATFLGVIPYPFANERQMVNVTTANTLSK